MNSPNSKSTFFGHPRGLMVLFFTEMCERFSYYGMRAILFLYLTKGITDGALGMDEKTGGAIYGLYTASVYLLTLPGGWIADNLIGQKKAIWWGGIVIMLGHIVLAIPGSPLIFFLGLSLVAIGTGLLKPNISSIVGELYPEGGARRDAGFSIFYMGINVGAFLGMFIVGYLGEKVGWHYGFGAAAIAMFLGLMGYRYLGSHLDGLGDAPTTKSSLTYLWVVLGLLGVLAAVTFSGLLDAETLAQGLKYFIIGLTVLYFLYIGFFDKSLTLDERKRVGVLFVFFIAAALFWSGYEQAGSSLTVFADRHTDRNLFDWQMPASWFQNAQSFYILVFSIPLGALWIWLSKRNNEPTTPIKFGMGVILMGLGFLVMYFGAKYAQTASVGMSWLMWTYLLHTIGELCLSPVGLSAYTKLAPKKYYSQMMGLWFVATSLGNLIAGLFAGNFDEGNVAQMPSLFLQVFGFAAIVGAIILFFSKPIARMMGNIK